MVSDGRLRYYMKLAYGRATESPDPSTQNGAVLIAGDGIDAMGYNHPPAGFPLNDWLTTRDIKLANVIHAEADAIDAAAVIGTPTAGTTLICPWAACLPCALRIIGAGVRRFVRHYDRMVLDDAYWSESIRAADDRLGQARVEVIDLSGGIPGAPTVRHRGKRFNPETCRLVL